MSEMTFEHDADAAPLLRRSPVGAFWRRFARNRTAVAGLVVILLLILIALFAPLLTRGYDPNVSNQQIDFQYLLDPHIAPTLNDFPLRIFGSAGLSEFRVPLLPGIVYAARPTLIIGLGAALLAALIGTLLGAVSGYFGGWLDALIMRLADLALSLPFMPFVIALIIASALPAQTVPSMVLFFSLVGWASIARLVRAQFLILRGQDFAEAARAVGVGHLRIILRHLLPNAVAPIIVATTLSVSGFILAETTMEYLNVLQLGQVTWGQIIAQGYTNGFLAGYWWWWFYPGLFVVLTVLAINYVGEGLREALDVRNRVY